MYLPHAKKKLPGYKEVQVILHAQATQKWETHSSYTWQMEQKRPWPGKEKQWRINYIGKRLLGWGIMENKTRSWSLDIPLI